MQGYFFQEVFFWPFTFAYNEHRYSNFLTTRAKGAKIKQGRIFPCVQYLKKVNYPRNLPELEGLEMKNFLPLLEGVLVTEKSSMNTMQSEPRTERKITLY